MKWLLLRTWVEDVSYTMHINFKADEHDQLFGKHQNMFVKEMVPRSLPKGTTCT